MATYFSMLSVLLGAFLMAGSPLISARDIPASEISLVQEPDAHYYLVKKNPVVLTCRAKNAAEIIFTCMDTRIPETSVEAEGASYIDPGLIQAKIEVTRADVQNDEGGEPFWCTCSAVDFDGRVAVTSSKGYVSIAFLKNKFTVKQSPITATVNEDVKILCGAPEGHPQPELIWRKDKKKLEMDDNPRLSTTEEGALLIQSVTAGDDGLYQCVVRNIAGRHESRGALLKVLALEESSEPEVAISNGDEVDSKEVDPGKPRTTRQTIKTYFVSEPEEKYYITENNPLMIDCSVVAADILTFRCNSKRMEKERQITNQGLDTAGNRNIKSQLRLTYAEVQAETNSSQIYQCACVAWFHDSLSPNGWGRIDSKSGHGFVHLAHLDDVFENEPSNVTAAPNTDVTMVCEPPGGEPPPWVHWFKDGSRLDPRSSNKYVVNVKGHLKINDIQRQDAGAYHCVVENVAKTVQSRVGLLTVIDTAVETTTAGQLAVDDIPEFPEVIPSTPVFLRDLQPQYVIDPDGTGTVVCAAISADQLTVDCGGRRLAREEFDLTSKYHQESGKFLLYAKTEITAESVAQLPNTYFCQCTAWSHNKQQNSWEQVHGARGYFQLGAAKTEYIEDVFAIAPEDTDAYFEADAKLMCMPPKGNPTPEVHWLKDGVRIDSIADPNYVIVEGELLFEYVRVSDEGQYTCVAENEAGTRSSKPVQFTVLGKPAATTASPRPEETSHKTESVLYPKTLGPFFSQSPEPNYYIIREQQSVNLSCTVIAATSLVFVCNGEVVQSTFTTDNQTWDPFIEASINKNSLVVTKENVDLHTGSKPYTCVCRAYYEEEDTQVKQDIFIDSSQALIQVAFLQNEFQQEPSDTEVTFLGTAELVCMTPIGIPEPTVYWLKNGYKISGNERIQVKDSGNLVINTFTEEDEGSYTCVAENLITSRTSRTAILSLSGPGMNATVLVHPKILGELKDVVQEQKMGVTELSADVQRIIDAGNERIPKAVALRKNLGSRHVINHHSYHNYSTIVNYLTKLAAKYPKHVRVWYLNHRTHEDRSVAVVKLSGTSVSNKPAIIVEVGIHAREWIAPASILWVMEKVLRDYSANKAKGRLMLDRFDWYLVPVTNPDGYQYSHDVYRFWRKNRRQGPGDCWGVDLNRNFDIAYGTTGVNHNCQSILYPGTSAFSEPETANIRDLFNSLYSRVRAYVSVHSYAQMLLIPWWYSPDVPRPDNHVELDRVTKLMTRAISRRHGRNYTQGAFTELMGVASGSSVDWAMHRKPNVISVLFELRPGRGKGATFDLPASEIIPSGQELHASLAVLAKEMRIKTN